MIKRLGSYCNWVFYKRSYRREKRCSEDRLWRDTVLNFDERSPRVRLPGQPLIFRCLRIVSPAPHWTGIADLMKTNIVIRTSTYRKVEFLDGAHALCEVVQIRHQDAASQAVK